LKAFRDVKGFGGMRFNAQHKSKILDLNPDEVKIESLSFFSKILNIYWTMNIKFFQLFQPEKLFQND
jgi:hypothetical protein